MFVIQGGNDPRVNINESDQIVEGLRKKGFAVPAAENTMKDTDLQKKKTK